MSTSKRAKAMVEIGASSKGLASGLSEAKKKVSRFKNDVGRFMREADTKGSKTRGGGKGGGFGAGFMGGLASGALGMVSSTLSDVADDVVGLEDKLARFQIAASRSPEQMAKMRAELDRISKATALNRSEIMAGASAYVAITGDADGATMAMESFARIGQASGSSMDDVALAAAALRDNLKLDPRDFEKAFSGLIAQGKAGAVEIKDLAGELAALAPQFASFKMGGGGLGSVAELGAAFQVARKGFGSASGAATGLKSMMTALVGNAAKFEKHGIKIFDKHPRTGAKTMRNFSNIWTQLNNSKLVKDPGAMLKAFGRVEALDTFRMFQKYPDLYHELLAASEDYGMVQRDLGTYMESNAGKMKASFNDVKLALAEAFTPERIKAFADLMFKIAEAAGWIVDKIGNIVEFGDGLVNGFEIGDDTGAIGQAIGVKKLTNVRDDEASKMSAKMLPVAMKYLQGKGAADYASMEAQMRTRAAGLREQSKGSILGVTDPSNVEATALTNMANFLAGQREGMRSSFQQMANAAVAKMMLSKTPIAVMMDSSTVAKTLDNAKSQRAPKKR